MRLKALLVCGAVAIAAASPVRGETVFDFSSWVPWNHPAIKAIYGSWADDVERVTEGRVKVRALPKPVASPPAHIDAVRTGQADAAMSVHDYSPKRFAAYTFSQLPQLGDTALHTSVALWRTHAKFFADKDFYRGVRLIGINTHGPGHLFVRTRNVMAPADMAGLKIRVGGSIPLQVVRAWQGVAIQQPAPKSYEILSTGIADGITFPWESVPGFNITALVKHATEFKGGLYSSSHYIFISEKKYQTLSDADKKAIDGLSGEAWARHAGKAWDKLNADGRDAAIKAGAEIVPASPALTAALDTLTAKFEADYVAEAKSVGIDGRAVLDFFKAEVKKVAAE